MCGDIGAEVRPKFLFWSPMGLDSHFTPFGSYKSVSTLSVRSEVMSHEMVYAPYRCENKC